MDEKYGIEFDKVAQEITTLGIVIVLEMQNGAAHGTLCFFKGEGRRCI